MKQLIATLSTVGLLICATAGNAQDAAAPNATPQATTMPGSMPNPADTAPAVPATASMASRHQMMKDCMAREKTANATMPKGEMKKTCKDQVKAQADNSTTPPRP